MSVKAVVVKVGMDSVTASYFALFEVINHTFGRSAPYPPVWVLRFMYKCVYGIKVV